MQSKVEPRQILLHEGIVAINRIVEELNQGDAHSAIVILRRHLEARAEQTQPREDFSDVLGIP